MHRGIHAVVPLVVLAAATISLVGCGGRDAVDNQETTSVDSAGVRIVTSPSPTGTASGWSVSATPRLIIGGSDGDEILHRVFSTAMLADGRILVSNSGTSELRVYTPEGRREVSFGRLGEGPGEFGQYESMRILRLFDDSVAVQDAAHARVHVFGLDGTIGRTFSVAHIEGYGRAFLVGSFADGRWLSFVPIGTGGVMGVVGDLLEMRFAFLVYDQTAQSATEIASVEGRSRVVNDLGGGGIHFPYIPLTAAPFYAIDKASVLYNEHGQPELVRVSTTGESEEIYRWSAPRTRVSDIRPRFNREFLKDVSEERKPAYERLLGMNDLPVPEFVPAVESALVDDAGYIWVARYNLPWTGDRVWDILDDKGVWRGNVTTPDNLDIHEIGADYLLGVQRDSLGVEAVVVYELAR